MKKSVFWGIVASAVLVAGVVLAIIQPARVSGQSSGPTADTQEIIRAYHLRETQYNQIIAKANQDLAKANQDLEKMAQKLNQMQANGTTNTGSQGITSEDARSIALKAVEGGTLRKAPELVNLSGQYAYEAVFEDNSTLYVDALNGSVLYNSITAAPKQITAAEAADIARAYMKLDKVYQTDMSYNNGELLYRVIFSTGDFVFVDTTGQIALVRRVHYTSAPTAATGGGGGGGGGGGSSSRGDDDKKESPEHEGGDDDD